MSLKLLPLSRGKAEAKIIVPCFFPYRKGKKINGIVTSILHISCKGNDQPFLPSLSEFYCFNLLVYIEFQSALVRNVINDRSKPSFCIISFANNIYSYFQILFIFMKVDMTYIYISTMKNLQFLRVATIIFLLHNLDETTADNDISNDDKELLLKFSSSFPQPHKLTWSSTIRNSKD